MGGYIEKPTWEQYEEAAKRGLSKTLVDQRLSMHWELDDALTRPKQPVATYDEEWAKWGETATKNGITRTQYVARRGIYWDPEKAATTPIMTKKELGQALIAVTKSRSRIPEKYMLIAEENGICRNTVRSRHYVQKWDLEDAITTPVCKGGPNRYRKKECEKKCQNSI